MKKRLLKSSTDQVDSSEVIRKRFKGTRGFGSCHTNVLLNPESCKTPPEDCGKRSRLNSFKKIG